MHIIGLILLIMIGAFVFGVILQPLIMKFIKKHFVHWLHSNLKRFEIEFRIEFYSQPSIHHLGEQGILVKTDPIKVQVDAETQDDALTIVDLIVKQEIKSELINIKEISKI